MDNSSGARPSDQALASGQAPAGLDASRCDPSRGRPSLHGAILGEALADIAKAGRVGRPELPDACATCAFREGSVANQMAATGVEALNCLLGVEDAVFGCHHGMKDGEPTRLCAGFIAARLAPYPIVLAAVQTVAARIDAMPERDLVREDFDAWSARCDLDGKMDNYQWGRARLRDTDRSPKGRDAKQGSARSARAGAEGIAGE